jgi:hypothetical protein
LTVGYDVEWIEQMDLRIWNTVIERKVRMVIVSSDGHQAGTLVFFRYWVLV